MPRIHEFILQIFDFIRMFIRDELICELLPLFAALESWLNKLSLTY